MDYTWDFKLVIDNWPVLWRGVVVTIQLWALAVLLGGALGFALSLGRLSDRKMLTLPLMAFTEVFRNTPVLIQLVWFYYAFPVLFGLKFTAYFAAALSLTLYAAAYYSEIFRAGLESVSRQQWDGARALGMTYATCIRRVVFPQAFRRMLPALTNRMIELGKVTSLASMLSVNELMYQGRMLSSSYYRPLEILTVLALTYFVLIWPGSYLAGRLEQHFSARS